MRLTDNSIKVIGHDPEPTCPALESNTDIEEVLSKKEIDSTKEIFKLIEKEARDYKSSKKQLNVLK